MLTENQIIQVEQSFLANLLYSDEDRGRFIRLVQPECFYVPSYGEALRKMQELAANGKDVNPWTLSAGDDEISKNIMELVEMGAECEAFDTKFFAHQIWENYNQRRLEALANNVKDKLKKEPPAEVMAWSSQESAKIINPLDVTDTVEEDVNAALTAAYHSENRVVPTGVEPFDAVLGGIDKGAMSLLAAHPAAGKTALALNIAWRIATYQGKVLFYSAEEAKQPLWWRIFSMQTGIPITAFRKGLSEQQREEFDKKKENFASRPLKIIDDMTSLADIQAHAIAEHAEDPVKLIVIDSASMIDSVGGESEVEKANRIGWQVTKFAKQLDIPVVLLAHVNNEGIKSKAGGLTNIYGGQGLVKPAQVVIELRKNNELVGKGVVIEGHIAKNRYGEVGRKIQLDFVGEHMRFYSH